MRPRTETDNGQWVRKRNRISHIAFDIGGFAVALDADHPIRREFIAADLTAADNSAGVPGDGGQGNAR
jgi:hypothetical protein